MRRALLLVALGLAVSPSAAAAAPRLYIRGAGFGHGVGMSQYGAYGYALHGWGYRGILRHYYSHTAITTVSPATTVRVLVGGGTAVTFANGTRANGRALSPGRVYTVVRAGGGVALVGSGRASRTLTVTSPGLLAFRGRRYHGDLVFRPYGGLVRVVNRVPIDNYVKGVVPSEMPSSWSRQALRAQAVAARTYALATRMSGRAFDLYSDTRSQVYGGASAETARTNLAVRATRGEIVTYRGRAAVTYFFSSSGGRTENVEDSFVGSPREPWLRSVADPYDGVAGNPYHRWGPYGMSRATAGGKLAGLVRGSFLGIRVLKRGGSPRVVRAAIVGTGGRTIVSGMTLKARFGLPDSWMSFSSSPSPHRHATHAPKKPKHRRKVAPHRRPGGGSGGASAAGAPLPPVVARRAGSPQPL